MNIPKIYREIPIYFEGEWSLEDKELILKIITEHDEKYFDMPFYNIWRFFRMSDGYIIVKRLTWDMGTISGENVADIVSKLKEYYS